MLILNVLIMFTKRMFGTAGEQLIQNILPIKMPDLEISSSCKHIVTVVNPLNRIPASIIIGRPNNSKLAHFSLFAIANRPTSVHIPPSEPHAAYSQAHY